MNSILFLFFSLLSLGEQPVENSEPPVQEAFTTYYFIRHAEKDVSDPQNKDPELSNIGQQRVEKWVEVFREIEFDMIFSTNYKRTRTTAARIAESQEKEVEFYNPKKLNDPDFQEKTRGKTVLVVGHSNTNPAFVNMVLGEKKYADIDEKESGSLFIVTIAPHGEKSSQVLYIN